MTHEKCNRGNLRGEICKEECRHHEIYIPYLDRPHESIVRTVAVALGKEGWLCWWDEGDGTYDDLGCLNIADERYVRNHSAGRPLHTKWEAS